MIIINKPSIEEILNSGCTCCTMCEIYCEHCLLYKKYKNEIDRLNIKPSDGFSDYIHEINNHIPIRDNMHTCINIEGYFNSIINAMQQIDYNIIIHNKIPTNFFEFLYFFSLRGFEITEAILFLDTWRGGFVSLENVRNEERKIIIPLSKDYNQMINKIFFNFYHTYYMRNHYKYKILNNNYNEYFYQKYYSELNNKSYSKYKEQLHNYYYLIKYLSNIPGKSENALTSLSINNCKDFNRAVVLL